MRLMAVLLLLLFYCSPGLAALAQITVKGTVVKYDKKTVTLEQNNKNRIVVPRNSIPPHFKITTGQEVSARLSSKKWLKNLQKKPPNPHPSGKKL